MTRVGQNAGGTEGKVQRITKVWAKLDTRRKLIAALAVSAILAGILAMSAMATTPRMKLLYAGLEDGAAGDVISSLEQRGIEFQVRGASIYVPADQRDELRMSLAGEGLPANGGRGYELLDSLNGFGTTSQMFDAAYWRATEGELARTIVTSRHISQARVHIAHDVSSGFRRKVEPTASVSVVPAGAPITPEQANAIRHLVASAVAGMKVSDVTVIDANGTLIGASEQPGSAKGAEDRAQMLRDRVLRLVEARVGPGNAVVEVSVDTVTETRSIHERRLDPKSRVAISTDVEEHADSSTTKPGSVTVASNLPDGNASSGDNGSANASSNRERVNYEVSETQTEVHRAPGDIRRLTVAVLVNGLSTKSSSGDTAFQPRSDEELAALRELVAAAVGFNSDRGDVITLKSMDLPAAAPVGTAAAASLFDRFNLDAMSLIQIGVLATVTLLLGLFVVRPLLSAPDTSAAPALPAPGNQRAQGADLQVLTGEVDDGSTVAANKQETAALTTGGVPALGEPSADPVDRLRAMIGERQEETVEILRGWLEEREETV